MKNVVWIILLFGLLQTQCQPEKKSICDSLNVSFEVLDYRDSLNNKGERVALLKESENWANEDFQYGYGFNAIPDSLRVNISVLPEELTMGPHYTLGSLNLKVSLGLKFGLGLDCLTLKNPLLKERLIEQNFILNEKDFLNGIKGESIEPAQLKLKVLINNLVKKNKPEGYHLNQLIFKVEITDINDNHCSIEFLKPVCSKKIKINPSPI